MLNLLDGPPRGALSAVLGARVLLFAFAFVAVAFVMAVPGPGLGRSAQLALGTGLVVVATSLLGAVWVWRGKRLRELALGQLLLDQALWTVIVYLTGGAASGATSLYGVTCLAGGLLLGVSGTVATALAGGVFFSLLVLLLQSGALDVPYDQVERLRAVSPDQVAYYFAVNILALVLVALLATYLAERLSRAGGALAAAEQRALQAERLAALGRLSAGLAHEIRNPLSCIVGAMQLFRSSEQASEDRQLCDIVLREAGRLEELVSDMVDLSRPRVPQLVVTNVAEVVSDVVQLASRSGRAQGDVSVQAILPAGPVRVRADAAQLRQLVWNLVRNSVQASAAGSVVYVKLEQRARVILVVQDEGEGIDEAARARLFDAFFTTRSHGTGIGLAVVKRIADEHGFVIAVESAAGKGATFRIDLGPPVTA